MQRVSPDGHEIWPPFGSLFKNADEKAQSLALAPIFQYVQACADARCLGLES